MIKNHPDRYVDQQMQSVVTAISPNLTINEQVSHHELDA